MRKFVLVDMSDVSNVRGIIRADREMRSVTIVSEPSCGLGDSPSSVSFYQWLLLQGSLWKGRRSQGKTAGLSGVP